MKILFFGFNSHFYDELLCRVPNNMFKIVFFCPRFLFDRDLKISEYKMDCIIKVECILHSRKVEKICKVEDLTSNFSWVVELHFVNFGQEVLMGNLEKFLKVYKFLQIFSYTSMVIQTQIFYSHIIVLETQRIGLDKIDGNYIGSIVRKNGFNIVEVHFVTWYLHISGK